MGPHGDPASRKHVCRGQERSPQPSLGDTSEYEFDPVSVPGWGWDIRSALTDVEHTQPAMDLKVSGGEGHRVWPLTEPRITGRISAALSGVPLYIADGHHRYESALAYRRQRRSVLASDGEQPLDFVMMTLVAFDEPGLLILPPHRLVRGIAPPVFEDLRRRLETLFRIEAWGQQSRLVGPNRCSAQRARPSEARSFWTERQEGARAGAQGYGVFVVDDAVFSLRTVQETRGQHHRPRHSGRSAWPQHEQGKVAYTYDREDAKSRVENGEFQLTFLLEPIMPETIKAIADVGDKMPKKSTYFYPKVPAGLIVNRLV